MRRPAAKRRGYAARLARFAVAMVAPISMTGTTAAPATTRAPPTRSASESAAAVPLGRAKDGAAPFPTAVSAPSNAATALPASA